MPITRPPCIGLDWSEAGFFASTNNPKRKPRHAQSKTRKLETDTPRRRQRQRPRYLFGGGPRIQEPHRRVPPARKAWQMLRLPPSDDLEISLKLMLPSTLRDALGRAAAARRESVSQFAREAIRQALRSDGVHA
jgi:hypothetical protein